MGIEHNQQSLNTVLNNGSRGHRYWREWRGFLLFIVVMLLFRSAIADWNQVPTGSMIPSILEGDRIVVDKTAYDLRLPFTLMRLARWADPERSDVITFESPQDGKLLVKRVIGVPGDEVQLHRNRLTINGQAASYQAIPAASLPGQVASSPPQIEVVRETILGKSRTVMTQRLRHPQVRSSFGPIRVPADHYLVLGDNRDNSQDFRVIGFVHRDRILGKANTIAFSLDYENYYIPRRDRFFQDLL
jgi:signal peptidase I